MIKIICFGKIKESYLSHLINDYVMRINKYHKLEIIELKDNTLIDIEEKEMLKYFDSKAYNVVLDINGGKVSSLDFAKLIDTSFISYSNINFYIGSSNGISSSIKERANKLISFGDITMPHGLFRAVLLEQIYRSFKIINNESYHK